MTDLPSRDSMSPAARKAELNRLNDLADQQLGIVKRDGSPLYTEKNLDPATKKALDETEQKKPSAIGHLYKISPDMEKKLEQFDKGLSDVPAPRKAQPILSLKERTIAWHKSLGSPQSVIDYELSQIKEGK